MSRNSIYGFRQFFRRQAVFSNVQKATTGPVTSNTSFCYLTVLPIYSLRNIILKSYSIMTKQLGGCSQCIKEITSSSNQKLLQFLYAKHLLSIGAQRIRRTEQIVSLYKNLGYDHNYLCALIERLLKNFSKKSSNGTWTFLLGSTLLAWDKTKISDSELDQVSHEFDLINDLDRKINKDWELIVSKKEVKVWRMFATNSDLYQYKVSGSYKDISARAFYNTQVDLEYRRQWDKNVISLDVIDKDTSSESEVVHWITQFPYPMSSREYIYVRRHKVDPTKNMMVIVSRGIDGHPSAPSASSHVRVTDYSSKMVIRPHSNFDENGFDYVLTYFDDPKSTIPKVAQSWATSSGIPDFVDKLHDAAVVLQQQKRKVAVSEVCYSKDLSLIEDNSNIDEQTLPM